MLMHPQLTVHEVIKGHPAALRLLTAAGIDTCCGSGLSLEQAAQRAGVAVSDLIRALEDGTAITDAGACGCGCKGS